MSKANELLYSPALRLKTGELDGVSQLTSDVADHVFPRFIVPPYGERDDAISFLMEMDKMPDVSIALSGAWQNRPALIDVSHILNEFGSGTAMRWLPEMFRRARSRDVIAIPAATLDDLDAYLPAYRASINRNDLIKFGIIISSNEILESDLRSRVVNLLEGLGVPASDCVAISDFSNAEFSEPEILSPIISYSLETLQGIALWKKIIFQGSNYPEKNPAPKEGGFCVVPRNEWIAWRLAVKFDQSISEHMIFGDYAADCSKIEFSGGRGRPIPHIRYAMADNWHVERGPPGRTYLDSIHVVYKAIVNHLLFSGSAFSQADAYIETAASSITAPHGGGTEWRQLNTTHHITRVIRDIAVRRGISIKPFPAAKVVNLELPF